MITISKKIKPANGCSFLSLFGDEIVATSTGQKMPAYIYAENLFDEACRQFIEGHNSDEFASMRINMEQADGTKPERLGFFLMPSSNEDVVMTNHFQTTVTISKSAACIAVWIIVLGQVASKINDSKITDCIYGLIQDLTLLSYEFTSGGVPVFNQQDKDGFYQLTN
jgi:hypothetical protein